MPHILHLGVGNFFRAHAAAYTQACQGWTITGVSFRSPAIRNGLARQSYTYNLVIKDAAGAEIVPITCLTDMLVAPENPEALIDAIADGGTDLITLTVTEKAYHLDPDGRLDVEAPVVRADLKGGDMTVVGALARGLARRMMPVTVLSCDNLPSNGDKLGAAVRTFARAAGLTLPADVTFPSCMVDRITPATTDAIRAEADDPMAVPTERFSEWVIENAFAALRPDWPGVQWVDDVAPHEMRKLRMLNGAHSYLAYAGICAGYTYVHETIADPALRTVARQLMSEAADTLPKAVQGQTDDYAAALITRFENPALNHSLRQIAMDGSQKLPIRIVATRQARGDVDSSALDQAIAAWVAFVKGECAAGRALDDPLADRIRDACAGPDPDTALRQLVGAA